MVTVIIIMTFRFENQNDYEYEIWFKVFSRTVKKMDNPERFITLFFTRKVSTTIFIGGG